MPLVDGAGVPLAVAEHGAGPGAAVLVLHGPASDAAAWGPCAAALAAGLGRRVVVPDRRGYGGSGAPAVYAATTVEEQAEDAAAVLGALDAAPATVVGDGFGALVALDLAKRHPALVADLVLLDPPLFAFVAEAAAALSEERLALEEALRAGGPTHAVEGWVLAHAPPVALPGRPDPRAPAALDRARRAARAFFADFAGLASWPVTRAQLRALEVEAAVVTDPGTPPHLVAAADHLAALLPHAARRTDGDLPAALAALPAR